jgi:phosphatidylglycerophosphatase A
MGGDILNNSRMTEFWATFLYLGRAPIMPGTFGTLGALPLIYLFNFAGVYGYMGLTFAFSLWAIRVADQYEQIVQDHDTKEVVIDEVAGYLIAMFWLPYTWQAFLYSFLIFRVLDIVKPFPIGWLDRRALGGFGTVADDLAAGVITNIILQFMYTQTNWLGSQFVFAS